MLKQKSKIGLVQKSRKKFDVADVFRALPRKEGNHSYSGTPAPENP